MTRNRALCAARLIVRATDLRTWLRTIATLGRSNPCGSRWSRARPRSPARASSRTIHCLPLPLYGVPFAIKDNIDLAGVPTTAGVPLTLTRPRTARPWCSALLDAGAIPIGKTNLDQFATGLVGTRSPYGACSSVFDARYISGRIELRLGGGGGQSDW